VRGAALIVLAWNQWALTRRCLDSLLASELDQAEVIVVDNGSEDDTAAGLAAYADRLRILSLPDNQGFVRGMNAGIAAARPDDDVVLLNNDLVFTQRDWLGRLRDAAYAAPEHGVVGCRLLGPEPEGRLYHAGGFIEADELWGQQTESGIVERDLGQYERTRRVQAIAFALAYLRRDCLERIGLLDTVFHSYFEDTDYCLRAADAGIASVVAGAVTLRHDQHGSTREDGGFRARLWAASRATFAARWQGRLKAGYRGQVLWQGATRGGEAYAQLARQLVRRLDARGARMAFAPVAPEALDAQDFRLDLAARRRWTPPADVAVMAAGGEHFARAAGRCRIGIGNSDWQRVPASWAAAANTLDLLLVPDAFQRQAFQSAGVTTAVELLPIGVDRDYCHPRVPAVPHPRGAFVFLAVVEDLARDAPERLLDAFRAAFASEAGVELLVYLRPGRGRARSRAALAPLVEGQANIRLLDGWAFPWAQRAQLLASIDCYVTARRGGAWDPLAAEALACGKALVATDFGSCGALARAHGLAVACTGLVEDARHPGACWAEPEVAALTAQLLAAWAARGAPDAADRAQRFAAHHDIEDSADRLLAHIARLGRFRASPARPPAHAPVQLQRPASGQIVVLGMHRSGTSSVAGLLARMGAHVGPQDDLLVGPDNPKGHYESGRLHGACLRRLAAAGGDWMHPPTSSPPAAVDAFRREVAALLDGFEAHRPWLIKEPRLCLLVRELLPLLTRPVFVMVVRAPQAVARSLATRDAMQADAALALWAHYNREAFAASRGWPRLLVDYDALLAEPVASMQRLLSGLQALGVAGLAALPEAEVGAWIDAPAAHSTPSFAGLREDQAALWAAICDGSILADPPAPGAP